MNIAFATLPAANRRAGPLDLLGHGYLAVPSPHVPIQVPLGHFLPTGPIWCSVQGKLGVTLRAGESFSLRRAAGATLRCEAGRLWVTEEGLAEDTALVAGQSTLLVRNGKALVLALRDGHLTLERGVEEVPA
jgi:hypothetical protein